MKRKAKFHNEINKTPTELHKRPSLIIFQEVVGDGKNVGIFKSLVIEWLLIVWQEAWVECLFSNTTCIYNDGIQIFIYLYTSSKPLRGADEQRDRHIISI